MVESGAELRPSEPEFSALSTWLQCVPHVKTSFYANPCEPGWEQLPAGGANSLLSDTAAASGGLGVESGAAVKGCSEIPL